MIPDDFYEEREDGFGGYERVLDQDLLTALRVGPRPAVPDAEVGAALAQLIHDQFTAYGTGGGHEMTDTQVREALAALRAILDRLGVPYSVPFRDFTGFRSYWQRKGASGSGGWRARRALLADVFDPMHEQLEALEQQSLAATLANPISPHPGTGWPAVDHEIGELRRQFLSASTPQDYNAVGLVCVRATQALSATVYDPTKHLRARESEPAISATKQRLERFVDDSSPATDNSALRKLVRSTIEYAEHVKHSATPTRREAGIAADATILLANILRRLNEP